MGIDIGLNLVAVFDISLNEQKRRAQAVDSDGLADLIEDLAAEEPLILIMAGVREGNTGRF